MNKRLYAVTTTAFNLRNYAIRHPLGYLALWLYATVKGQRLSWYPTNWHNVKYNSSGEAYSRLSTYGLCMCPVCRVRK